MYPTLFSGDRHRVDVAVDLRRDGGAVERFLDDAKERMRTRGRARRL